MADPKTSTWGMYKNKDKPQIKVKTSNWGEICTYNTQTNVHTNAHDQNLQLRYICTQTTVIQMFMLLDKQTKHQNLQSDVQMSNPPNEVTYVQITDEIISWFR